MPLYDVQVEIHDGEHEYNQHHYVFCKDIKEAQDAVIRDLSFNDKHFFNIETCPIGGEPISWIEVPPGYRIYKIGTIEEAKIRVLGLTSSLDLTELMHRPVLPLDTKSAEWIWSKGDCFEHWWDMGEYYIFLSVAPGDSEHVYIGTFDTWELSSQIESMEDTWKMDKEPKDK